MNYCGDFSEVYSKLSHFSLMGLGGRQFLILMIPSQKYRRKIWNVSLESHRQILDKSRIIQDSIQFTGRNKTSNDSEQH